MNSRDRGRSLTGFVLGMAQIVVKPPRAAARAARPDRLLLSRPGLAEMDVHVDEAGSDDEPRGVDRPSRRRASSPGPTAGDPAVLEQDVQDRVGRPIAGSTTRPSRMRSLMASAC